MSFSWLGQVSGQQTQRRSRKKYSKRSCTRRQTLKRKQMYIM